MASEFPPASVKPLAEELAALLKERKETISIAETVRKPAFSLLSLLLMITAARLPAVSSPLLSCLRPVLADSTREA